MHLQLSPLADESLLRRVRQEVIEHVSATYKETDLFKVFQTGMLCATECSILSLVGVGDKQQQINVCAALLVALHVQ
jgi:hypothetical protein